MRIPGRLKDTTLGDVLGALYRERATGFLELVESPSGRVSRVELRDGKIVGLDSASGPRLGTLLSLETEAPDETGARRAGEDWLARGLVSPEQLRGALRVQLRERLEQLFRLSDAALRFRAPRPREDDPTAPAPLDKEDFLLGRPRRRASQTPTGTAEPARPSERATQALRVLGLPPNATPEDVQQAFRKLARESHPDRHPDASPARRAELLSRFVALSRAYHQLTG